MRERGRLREGAGCGLRSGCVGLISRSSVLAGREGECRYLFNLVCARPFGLGPYILDAPIGRTPFSACVSSARHLIKAQYDWGNVCSISVRSFLWYNFDHLAWVAQLMASWRWWPHGRAAQYDWGNIGSISVRSILRYSFDQLAWVAPIDCQLALVAPWPSNGPRGIN